MSAIQGDNIQAIPVVYLQWTVISKEEAEVISSIVQVDSWMSPLIKYLKEDTLPKDKVDARKIQRQASRFTLYGNQLPRRSLSQPYLNYLAPKEAHYVLAELHDEEC